MQCNFCENQATVHLSQIVNKKVHKIDLCEECAKAKGVDDPIAYSLAGLAEDLSDKDSPNMEGVGAEVKCSNCGMTRAEFKKSGRLGCPSCYEVFSHGLEGMLKSMHKGGRHVGKVPSSLKRTIVLGPVQCAMSDILSAE